MEHEELEEAELLEAPEDEAGEDEGMVSISTAWLWGYWFAVNEYDDTVNECVKGRADV